jgi:hypothetical protein
VDSQPQTSEDEPTKSDYYQKIEWISCGFGFFSTGLIALFPFYIFSLAITDYSTLFFYAFLFGCLASRLLLLVFLCKFPPMFWLCSSLVGSDFRNIIKALFQAICGVSICCFSFEELRLFSPAIYGMGLSMIWPSITSLLAKYKGKCFECLPINFDSPRRCFNPSTCLWLGY